MSAHLSMLLVSEVSDPAVISLWDWASALELWSIITPDMACRRVSEVLLDV